MRQMDDISKARAVKSVLDPRRKSSRTAAINAVAKRVGVSSSTLRRWVLAAESAPAPKRTARKSKSAVQFVGDFDWVGVRDSGIAPRTCSALGGTDETRRRFIRGAEALGLNTEKKPIHPQQLLVSDMLAVGLGQNVIMLPRRSSKSTSLIAEGLGRAWELEDYRVGILTMTTGKAGRARFLKDVVPVLERKYPDKSSRPFKIVKSAGQERVEFFQSGGMVCWLSSIDDLIGEAFDMVILDEASKADAEKAEETLSAALPTLDTRPDAQIVVAGTAGEFRTGNLLWNWLEDGHAGEAGILEYCAPEHTTIEDIESWETTLPLVLEAHPGIGTLTTIERVQTNWRTMKPGKFLREYLSIFGIEGVSNRMIKPDVWGKRADDGDLPKIPERFAVALTVHRDQTVASLTIAWRDEKAKSHAMVIMHDRGVAWVQEKVHAFCMKYKVPLVHDSLGVVLVETEALAQKRPQIRFSPQSTRNITTAAALLVKEIDTGHFVHHNQAAMNDAVAVAVKRRILSAWGFGTTDPMDDITPLEGAAMALRAYDQDRPKQKFVPNF